MAVMMIYLYLLIIPELALATLTNYRNVPEDDFYIPGDINLGIIDAISGSDSRECDLWYTSRLQAANAALFRINEVNNDPNILPNISLGIVILNDCWDVATALYRTTKLIPVDGSGKRFCDLKAQNATNPSVKGCYDVAATLISYSSGMSVVESRLLSMYKIPHISFGATADILSDRNQFGYFNRLVPPNKYQAHAMMDMLITLNWTYISLIGTPTAYSRDGITEIRVVAKKYGICIACYIELQPKFTDDDYDEVVRQLRSHSKARVVIVFTEGQAGLGYAINRAQAKDDFIFLGGDGSGYVGTNDLQIFFSQELEIYESFEKYYNTLSPWEDIMGTPGIYEKHTPEKWECSMDLEKGENGSCLNYETLADLPSYYMSTYYKPTVDALNVLISALDNMIHQNCPSAFKNYFLLRECVEGKELLRFIRNTTFKGYSQTINFEENGDGKSNLDIWQLQWNISKGSNERTRVGTWVVGEKRLYLYMDRFEWYTMNETLHLTSTNMPESVCAKPCKQGEFFIQGELKCCWECRKCRDNEKVRDDIKGCTICPILTWPDQENFTTCEPIPPTYMDWLDPLALGLLGLSGIGLLSTLAVTYIFIKYRQKKVVKGSSLEQMMMIIVALYMSFTTAILLVAKPIYSLCLIQYYSFHLSCTLTFVPLLLKTTRLYRIFAAAERCQQVVRFVSSKALGLFSLTLIGIVALILMVCTICYELEERLQMPVITEKFVELVCHVSSETLLIPLCYNLLLLLLCAVYGFLTRKLPDNFNESWYIFISVSTTLFVWLAFLPTYSLAFYAYHKSALLGLALILNAIVTAVCIFAPKIYAIYYITEDSIKVTNFEGAANVGGSTAN